MSSSARPGQSGGSHDPRDTRLPKQYIRRGRGAVPYSPDPIPNIRREASDPARVSLPAAAGQVPPSKPTVPATGSLVRPGLTSRAYSAPLVPKDDRPPAGEPTTSTPGAAEHTGPGAGTQSVQSREAANDEDEDEESSEEEDEEEGDGDIADDPFFQRFSLQPGVEAEDGESDDSSEDEDTDIEAPSAASAVPNALRVTTAGATAASAGARPDSTLEPLVSPISPIPRNTSADWPDPSSRMQEINIAVLGASSVGKSTFIQRAFNLTTLPDSPVNQRKNSIDGNVYVVRLVEFDFDDLDVDEDNRIVWPDSIDGYQVPPIDGAFALYDVMSQESLEQLPATLIGIYHWSIPFILVAAKCDNPPSRRIIDPAQVNESARGLIGDINAFLTSYVDPDSQKRCVAVLLRAIVSVRINNIKLLAAARRRAHSSTIRSPVRPSEAHKHSRANSEFGAASAIRNRQEAPMPAVLLKNKSSQNLPSLPTRRGHHDFDVTPETDSAEFEDSDAPEPEPAVAPPGQRVAEVGTTFQELVNRLLAQPMSKADTKYVAIFLALYRKFAAPGQLLEVIFQRFDDADREDSPQLVKAQIQLRQLNILGDWISTYPGDFAYPTTRKRLDYFINRLAPIRLFSIAARELTANLDNVVDDDDTDWAFCDRNRERSYGAVSSITKDMVGVSVTGEDTPPHTPGSRSASNSASTSSSQTLLNIVESAQRQARLVVYNPRTPISKLHWRMLMEQTEEAIAKELTRMDWIMFQSIRPRDLIRHVSLSTTAKAKCRSLENVQRMIDHFNHVALWVTNFVLLRDKPKHRAMMLEKFMKVARELRKLNNYNALGAIVAGINSTAIHRLSTTKELIPQPTTKDFMKLEILMSSQKSHSAYRLAWENTPNERIPYLPLHRRDLVSASEGNRTFVGENDTATLEDAWLKKGQPDPEARINWRKFEIMGEVVVSVQRAQAAPYPANQVQGVKNDEMKALVCEVEICKDEDTLYSRSCSLEQSGVSHPNRKRFQFFNSGKLAVEDLLSF